MVPLPGNYNHRGRTVCPFNKTEQKLVAFKQIILEAHGDLLVFEVPQLMPVHAGSVSLRSHDNLMRMMSPYAPVSVIKRDGIRLTKVRPIRELHLISLKTGSKSN